MTSTIDTEWHRSLRNPIEEKNEFAMDVLRRVRLKLEGREPDALKRSSVAKQVRCFISFDFNVLI